MNQQKIREIQERFYQKQQAVSETIASANGEVAVTMNGNIEITQLTINKNLLSTIAEPLLIDAINTCIKKVSAKIKDTLIAFQQEIQTEEF